MDELVKYTGQVPAKYSAPEMAVIQALENSPKILSMSTDAIAIECSGFLVKAFVDAGFEIKGGNASMLILANSVADDLFTYFKTLSIKEAGLAIKNGIRGEYGEFMGINVKTIHQFCKAYKESFDRSEVIRKQAMKEIIEEKPTPEQIKKYMDERCILAFNEYRESGKLIDNGGAKFTHLKQSGIITLTSERYSEIMAKAVEEVKTQAIATIQITNTESSLSAISKAVLEQGDKHEITKNAARLIALKEYFDYLIEFEFELSDEINANNQKS